MEFFSVFKFFESSTVVALTVLMHDEILFTLKWPSVGRYLALLGVVSSVDPPRGEREKGYCLPIWGKRKDLIKLRNEER